MSAPIEERHKQLVAQIASIQRREDRYWEWGDCEHPTEDPAQLVADFETAQTVELLKDRERLEKLIECGCPTFLENDAGHVCLDETQPSPKSEPMSNYKHWPTPREAIDHMHERTIP